MVVKLLSCCLILLLVDLHEAIDPKDQVRNDIAKLKDEVNKLNTDHQELDKSLDALSTGLDAYIDQETTEQKRKEKAEKLDAVLKGAISSITNIKDGSPAKVIMGIMDITSVGLATFGGPVGFAASVVLNFVNSLIGVFTTYPTTTPAVDKILKEVLNEFYDTQLNNKMQAFQALLTSVQKALKDQRERVETEGISDSDIDFVNDLIEIGETVKLLEEVKLSLNDEFQSGKVPDSERALKTLNAYVKVYSVLELVINEFISLIELAGKKKDHQLKVDLYINIMSDRRIKDKSDFEFLHDPEPKHGLIASIYQFYAKSTYEAVGYYFEKIDVKPIPDLELKEGDVIHLSSKRWRDWYFYMTSDPAAEKSIWGSKTLNDQNKFIIKRPYSTAHANTWMLYNKYYSKRFIVARKFDACGKYPTPLTYVQGYTYGEVEFGIRSRPSACGSGCSNCYEYFAGGQNRGSVAINVNWRFTKLKLSAGCPPWYLISATEPQFGPGYTLYMANTNNGNAYLQYGYPGEAGVFKKKTYRDSHWCK